MERCYFILPYWSTRTRSPAGACNFKKLPDHVLSHHFSKNLSLKHTAYACSKSNEVSRREHCDNNTLNV
jgi:hypothetical protein